MADFRGILNKIRGKVRSELEENIGLGKRGLGDLGAALSRGRQNPVQEAVRQIESVNRYTQPSVDRVQDFATDIAQATPRTAAQVALTLDPRYRDLPAFTPETSAQQFLFGAKPINRLQDRYQYNKEFGQNLGLDPRLASGMAFLGTAVGAGGDLVPGVGGAKKKIAKEVGEELLPAAGRGLVKQRKFITSVKKSPDVNKAIRDAVTGDYTVKSNKKLVAEAARGIQSRGINNAVQDSLLTGDVSDKGVAQAIILAQELQKTGRNEEAAQILVKNAERLTESGRAVQAASLLNRLSAEGLQSIAARTLAANNQQLTGVQVSTIKQLMDAADAFPAGSREQNLARQKAFEYVRSLSPSPVLDQIAAVWKAGLLTGVKTSGINIAANAANQILKKSTDPVAAGLDSLVSLATGQRTKTTTLKGIGQGAGKGISEGWDFLISGYDPRKIGTKMEEKGVAFSDNIFGKVGKGYAESVFRFIGAQDRPFYYSAMYNSLYDQGLAVAKNQRIPRNKLNSFLKKFVESPPVEAAQVAARDAERATFQNNTALADWGRGFANSSIGQFIMPFLRTPSAVVTEIMNYTPVGVANTLVKNARKGKFDQRQFVEGLSKGLTGTGILAIGWELGEAGAINTAYPKGEKERALWEAEGRQSNRLIIGNTQIDVQSLGPAGPLLIAGATAAQAKKKGEAALVAGASGIGNTVLESPFLSGASDLIDLVKNPIEQGNKYIARQAGSVVPTLSSDIAQATDRDVQGRIRATKPENALEGVMNRVPGLRGQLDQKVDVFGNPLSTNKNTFQTLADPLRSQNLTTDNPVISEFRRLMGTTDGVDFTRPKDVQKAFGEEIKLDADELRTFQAFVGQEVQTKSAQLINSPLYQASSEEAKKKALNRIVDEARERGKLALVSGQVMAQGGTAADVASLISQVEGARKKETGRPSKAELDLAKARVESGEVDNIRINDRYGYRLDPETGQAKFYDLEKVRQQSETKKLGYDMELAKETKNYSQWQKLADKQFAAYEAELETLDPELDAVRVVELNEKMLDLAQQAAKYKGYGGFKKPKKLKKVSVSVATGSMPKFSAPQPVRATSPKQLRRASSPRRVVRRASPNLSQLASGR